jgi:hypothetical protein
MRTALALMLLVVAGCGRKATRADCQFFVDHNVEVQLKHQGTTDPMVIEQEKVKARDFFKAKIDECVGKRVTDRMIGCVESAETTDQIDKCLR